jgi:hypothetical protein
MVERLGDKGNWNFLHTTCMIVVFGLGHATPYTGFAKPVANGPVGSVTGLSSPAW